MIVCIYADYLMYMDSNTWMVEKFKQIDIEEFEMTNLRIIKYFLGIQVK